MSLRQKFDLSAYLVIGPENTLGRSVSDVVTEALRSGFTFIQIRSKVASAKELIDLTNSAARAIQALELENKVALVVNDRLDVVLAARSEGVKVDGIHVGQSDIPVEVCREYLGKDAIIGLSARTDELLDYVTQVDTTVIDYLGAGPLHETNTKPDCGLSETGQVITRSFDELRELAKRSPLPVVVGGGVKARDLAELKTTGVAGFFVVSAVTEAENPGEAARELVQAWHD